MFKGDRYLTRGIQDNVPIEFQLFMWETIDRMPEPKDYLQVFDLKIENGLQVIYHHQERPDYKMIYVLAAMQTPIATKVFVIDDYYADEDKHIATMLLAEEY